MNIWTTKSFGLHDSPGYLDKLHNIYPMQENMLRPLNSTLVTSLRHAFNNKDNIVLFKLLLLLDKFPLKDSYKPYFTRTPKDEQDDVIVNNMATVDRICQRIYIMGFEKMIEGLEMPIETNRQIGPMFPNWIRKQYPSYSDPVKFLRSTDFITVFESSDGGIVKCVKNYVKVDLPTGSSGAEKGLDMLIKVNTQPIATLIMGEAKFLTDEGGHQNAQLKDALHLITSTTFKNNGPYKVLRIAILDGVCWIASKNTKMQADIRGLSDEQIAISALLLDEFFKSL